VTLDMGSKAFDPKIVRGVQGRRVHLPPNSLRWRGRGIFTESAQRADHLHGQIKVWRDAGSLERDAVAKKTGVGRVCTLGNQPNTTPLPAKIYANEGLARCSFRLREAVKLSYKDKKGNSTAHRARIGLPGM